MYLQCKLDGSLVIAELMLRRERSGRRVFVIVAQGRARQRMVLGALGAVIAYRVVSCTSAEKSALLLAGFHLDFAARKRAPLSGIVKTLMRTGRSARRKTGEPLPDAEARHPTRGQAPNQMTRVPDSAPGIRKPAKLRGTMKHAAPGKLPDSPAGSSGKRERPLAVL
jgi:hypothetical protein